MGIKIEKLKVMEDPEIRNKADEVLSRDKFDWSMSTRTPNAQPFFPRNWKNTVEAAKIFAAMKTESFGGNGRSRKSKGRLFCNLTFLLNSIERGLVLGLAVGSIFH